MRPTPFSDIYPESYRALASLHPNLDLTPEYWKRQYLHTNSKVAKEHAKERFCEISTLTDPMSELKRLDKETEIKGTAQKAQVPDLQRTLFS